MNKKFILSLFIFAFLALALFGCGGGSPADPLDKFKANKAELGEDWSQFRHDASFGCWNFKEETRPREHKTPKGVRVFWNGAVTDEEKSLIDAGISEMLAACRQNTNQWSPGNVWTKFVYFQRPEDFKIMLVESNYTLQEGEAANCAGMITGPQGVFTAAGTVCGLNDRAGNSSPGSKGGVYITIPKQTPAQFARAECKNLMKNAVRNEGEHVWLSNDSRLYFAFANDGVNGNHPYCVGTK